MFKRANKITALLVAAASVMSLVPAMAADSTRLGTKDGTIEDAIAYKDGKYAFEGYKTDDNNKSVYFNDGSKDKEVNDLTDARINQYSKYDTSSTIAMDGNDEYLLDLSNGKVTDEDVASDLQSTATDKLLAKLKKADRYGSNVSVSTQRITPDQFGDVWYSYTATNGIAGATDGRGAVIEVTPTNFASNITVYGKTFIAAGTGATGDFSSGSKAGFAIKAATMSFSGYTANIKSESAGTIQLTGTTTGAAAAVNVSAIQALSTNVTITADTVVDGSVPVKLTVGIVDATKPATIATDLTSGHNVTVSLVGAGTTSFSSAATFAATVKSDSIPGYSTTVDATTGKLTLTANTAATIKDYTALQLAGEPAGTFVNATAALKTSGYAGTGNGTGYDVYHGYTNKSAAYIDADKTANIRVYNGSKMVKLDEFDENVNDDKVAATIKDGSVVTIAQDKDYIYRIIDVDFSKSTVAVYNSKGTTPILSAKYLQKISKAQGETEKDAYLPKTVESYELDATISGDAETAATKLATLVSGDSKVVGVRVVDGTLYYTEMDDADTIKTYVLKLQKNEKVEAVGTSTKVDAYVVKKDGDKDHDLKGDAGKAGASFDINGNLWIINEGKIYKSEKAGDFKEMFTCDRSIDSLDVYDAGSLIAWDGNGNVYTTQQEGTKVTEGESTAVKPVIVTGWVQGTDGTWTFNDVTGAKVTNKWITVGGTWYMMKADGIMATGWYLDNGTWYFLKPSGAMVTGWYNDNGTWYYLNASGAMLANTTVDGYVLNGSGAWVK
ncbi:hypothetical protein psyc5s11_51040 [Clostridium gelidum]|uniref:Uncharacterized protein n=1 Tax=Clostridium gelidum TaxID=704125 RepID=A0ABM7TB90_9CLOT|nr:hypothetical protein [Clostridium gelidum]BCZ49037.1 hypothetical protein psyc5s11_51040 [Clostridium gelidum]